MSDGHARWSAAPSFRDRLAGMETQPSAPPAVRAAYHQQKRERLRDAGLDEAWNRRLAVARLVREAASLTGLRADVPQRSNMVRLLCALYRLNGASLGLDRGWIEAVRTAFRECGLPVPNPAVVRWYRSHLQDDPMYFRRTPMADVETLEAIELKYLA